MSTSTTLLTLFKLKLCMWSEEKEGNKYYTGKQYT